jgi:hypothetical protein
MWKSATTAADLYQRIDCGRMLWSVTTTILLGAIDVMRYQLASASETYEEQRRQEMATLEAEMYNILIEDVEDAVTKAEAEFDRIDSTTIVDRQDSCDTVTKSEDNIDVGGNQAPVSAKETLSSFEIPRFGLDLATREHAAEVARQGVVSKLGGSEGAAVSDQTRLGCP